MTTKFRLLFLLVLALTKIAVAEQPRASLQDKAKIEPKLVIYGDTAEELSGVVNVNGHAVEQFRIKGAPVDWVGANAVIVSVHPVAVSAKATSPNAARLFVDFVFSKEGQSLISDVQRIPTRLEIPPKLERLTMGLTLRPSDPVFEVNNLQRGEKLFREILKL